MVARPGIRSPQELRGKKIGVLSVIGLNQIVVATALRHWGIDEKSIMLVRSGGSRDRFTALQNGLIDATVLTGAFVDRAKAAGMPVLLDLGDLEDSFATVSLLTSRTLQNPSAVLCAVFSRGSARRFIFSKAIRARTKEPVEVDTHTGQKSARKRLPEFRAADFFSTVYRTVRSQVAVDDLVNTRADAKRQKGTGVRQ